MFDYFINSINFYFHYLESLKKELFANRNFHMLLNSSQVNEEFYPKQVLDGSVKSLKYLLNSSELQNRLKNQEILFDGLQGSFRKLEID